MKDIFKNCEITPVEAFAGDSVEIRIKIKLACSLPAGSRIILDLETLLGMSRPSNMDQEDDGYIQLNCSNPLLKYRLRTWDMEVMDFPSIEKTSFKGMAQRFIVLDIDSDELVENDIIEFIWGWTRDGFGTGTKLNTLVIGENFVNTINIRYFEDGSKALPDLGRSFKDYKRPVPDSEITLNLKVKHRDPESIRLIRRLNGDYLMLLDRFSNICTENNPHDFISGKLPDFRKNHYGLCELCGKNISVNAKLPMRRTPEMSEVFKNLNIYWGDLHTHSAVSNDCIEREKQPMRPADMYDFAENAACLDFLAVTDHHQPWDIERNKIGEANWNEIVESAEKADRSNEFTAFPGLEFRGPRGDTAVIFPNPPKYSEIDDSELKDIRRLWKKFHDSDILTIPHFHNAGQLDEEQWYSCPYKGMEPSIEIYSCHGSYENLYSRERRTPSIKARKSHINAVALLKNNYRFGLTCNSDGHKGNPGFNGLTAVFAESLSRKSILDSYRKRNAYGTTNARIKLLFTVDDLLMGSEIQKSGKDIFYIAVEGEKNLKSIELLHNGEIFHSFRPDRITFEKDLKLDAEPGFWYVRVIQHDNHMAWSSPIWIN